MTALDTVEVDCAVIGAGVVGAAVGMRLAERGLSVAILERGPRPAEGITSRNSGVIHAGLYYPPTSLKARLCVEGNALIYDWCAKQGVAFLKTGKLIVATNAVEAEVLSGICDSARASGAVGVSKLTRAHAQKLEPRSVPQK